MTLVLFAPSSVKSVPEYVVGEGANALSVPTATAEKHDHVIGPHSRAADRRP